MCGIAGFVDFHDRMNMEILREMTDTLQHRGPDGSGYRVIHSLSCSIGLGHRRLSIIDLSENATQPMDGADEMVVFNGEIYNYREIRKEIESGGIPFSTSSDTEVLLKAFNLWGPQCVNKFIGMFAFAIHDRKNERVMLFRDRAGVKPLYYTYSDNILLFASEPKAIYKTGIMRMDIDMSYLKEFINYGYVNAPNTVQTHLKKVKPGHYMQLNLRTKKLTEHKYWDVMDFYRVNNDKTPDMDYIEKLLLSAFNYRLVADVPVGIFLSGGYDSTLVTAMLQKNMKKKLKTFTIGFKEDKFNEAVYAKKIAEYLDTDHTEYYCTYNDAMGIFDRIPDMYDEPMGDSSVIPTALVSNITSEYVKVALSADGGDETFGGYMKYEWADRYGRISKKFPNAIRGTAAGVINAVDMNDFPFKRGIKKTRKLRNLLKVLSVKTDYELFEHFNSHSSEAIPKLFTDNTGINKGRHGEDFGIEDRINRMLAEDYVTYLSDDILMKVDRASMQASLEGREPLLDHRIIEYTAGLEGKYKFNNGVKKVILKKLLEKYLPVHMFDRPKRGFNVPIEIWMRRELKHKTDKYLHRSRIKREGIFSPEYVTYLKNYYLSGASPDFLQVWHIIMFEMWFERWMK